MNNRPTLSACVKCSNVMPNPQAVPMLCCAKCETIQQAPDSWKTRETATTLEADAAQTLARTLNGMPLNFTFYISRLSDPSRAVMMAADEEGAIIGYV